MLRRLLPFAMVVLAACSSGERDADDVVEDLEGTVSAATVERLLRDVDLTRTALTIHVGTDAPERFGPDGQRALEDYLRDAAQRLSGASVEVTQRVVEERGSGVAITLTLRVRQGAEERYVPAALEVTRAGRRWVVTRARVMRKRGALTRSAAPRRRRGRSAASGREGPRGARGREGPKVAKGS